MEDYSDLESSWDDFSPREQSGDFGPQMPDGQHQALLVDVALKTRASDDHRQLYVKFVNREGTVRDWYDLDNDIGLSIAQNALVTFGFEPPDTGRWAAVQSAIDRGDFKDLVCNIGVRTKPGDSRDFTSVYINGCQGKAEDPDFFRVDPARAAAAPSGGGSFPAATDDDIPF